MSRTRYHVVTLNSAQMKALASLTEKHPGYARVYQSPSSVVSVEFAFPYRYILATNGRAIPDHA